MNGQITEHVFFPVVTRSGSGVDIEIRIIPDTVEVWREDRCSAVLDRGHLRSWLAEPTDSIGMGEVMFTIDRCVDVEGRIAITLLPDVDAWTLDERTAIRLRNRIG